MIKASLGTLGLLGREVGPQLGFTGAIPGVLSTTWRGVRGRPLSIVIIFRSIRVGIVVAAILVTVVVAILVGGSRTVIPRVIAIALSVRARAFHCVVVSTVVSRHC